MTITTKQPTPYWVDSPAASTRAWQAFYRERYAGLLQHAVGLDKTTLFQCICNLHRDCRKFVEGLSK